LNNVLEGACKVCAEMTGVKHNAHAPMSVTAAVLDSKPVNKLELFNTTAPFLKM
jgi:hypothetical protein